MADRADANQAMNRRFLSTIKFRYIRHIVQAQVLVLILYAVTNYSLPIRLLWHVDPLLSISAALSGDVTPAPFLMLGAAMLVGSIALGRAFCGWICPLGLVQDLTSFGKRKKWVPEALRYAKYVILVGGLLMPVLAGWTFLEWLTPMSVLPRALGPFWGPHDSLALGLLVFLVAVFFAAATEKRAWCRYVCPLGAILSVPASRKAIGISVNEERCIKCLKCERSCTMGIIDIKGQSGLRWDSECVLCLACRDACPTNAVGPVFRP